MNRIVRAMSRRAPRPTAALALVAALVMPAAAQHRDQQGLDPGQGADKADPRLKDDEVVNRDHPRSPRVFLRVPGETVPAVLYASGERIQTEWETLWRPMCGSGPAALTQADLAGIAARWAQRRAAKQAMQQPDDPPGEPADAAAAEGGIAGGGGLNIVFDTDGSVPGGALVAMAAVHDYYESIFDDDITIHVNVTFEAMPPDVLGATGSNFTKISWPLSRAGLQDGMDPNDNIQNYLPSGSTIKVRYDGSDDITNENRVWWTRANFKATVGGVSGDAADMSFNSNLSWDYDPSNGIVGESFQDVLVHECGHALGFTSGADFRYLDMEALDIFRFQRTGGGHDYNPDTTAEFKVRPRLVSFDDPNNDVVVDVITAEYRMSDGDPYQAGHFREQSDNIGLMDPAIATGETHYPNFFSSADLKMFDAIGYDR